MGKVEINVYRCGGQWYGAIWIDGVYDSCDSLPCGEEATERQALACAETMPLLAAGARTVRRVDDVDYPAGAGGRV
jgi:hypothetical protein